MNSLRKVASCVHSQSVPRLLHTTSVATIDIKWRRSVSHPQHTKHEPEFLDRPDYSFLDGRPTPLGQKLLARYLDEKRLAEVAVKKLGEIDYALRLRETKRLQQEEEAREILSRKLKPKGPAYKPKQDKDLLE